MTKLQEILDHKALEVAAAKRLRAPEAVADEALGCPRTPRGFRRADYADWPTISGARATAMGSRVPFRTSCACSRATA